MKSLAINSGSFCKNIKMESNVTALLSEENDAIVDRDLPSYAKPETVIASRKGKRWSVDEDNLLKQEMGALTPDGRTLIEYVNVNDALSQIAEKHGRTSRAIKFRLLYLAHRAILEELKTHDEELKTLPSRPYHQALAWSCILPILEKFALTKDEYVCYLQTNPKEMNAVKQYIQQPESKFVFDENAYF